MLPVVVITKNDASTYTANYFTGVKNFGIDSLELHLPFDRTGGTFKLVITSSDASNSAMNTLLGNISNGNEILFYIGKSDAGKQKIFRGIIETTQIDEPNKNTMKVTLSGPDWGSDLLKHRVVNGSWIQKKLSDGVTLDNTDNTVLINQIISDLTSDSNRYMVIDGITAVAQGLVYDSTKVVAPSLRVAQFEANGEKLDDKLSALDDIAGTVHFVDPDKNLIVHPALATTDSGLLLTDDPNDSLIATWAAGYVGLIATTNSKVTYKKTLENHQRRLIGLGGDASYIDQKQETNSGTTNMDSNFIAQQFQPVFEKCQQIGVYVGWVGIPTANLILSLVQDNGGLPTGTVVRTIQKGPSEIIAAGGWIYFPIGDVLNVKTPYWVILQKAGTNINTYKWYRDAVDHNPSTSATSSDGLSWSLTTTPNRFNYMFRQYYNTPIMSVYPFTVSSSDKHFHEEVYRYPYINQQDTLTKYLTGVAPTLLTQKEIIICDIYASDVLPTIGQSARCRKQQSGYVIDGTYVIGDLTFSFQASDDGQTGNSYFGIQAVQFTTFSST